VLKNITIRARTIALAVVGGGALLIVGFTALYTLNSMSHGIDQVLQQIDAKRTLLGKIQNHIGYGGMIHHFKNYVLRGDEKYADRFNVSVEQVQEAAARYARIGYANEQEKQSLLKGVSATDAYAAMLPAVSRMVKAGSAVGDIDAIVKINDQPYLDALVALDQQLTRYWENDTGELIHLINLANTVVIMLVPLMLLLLTGLGFWVVISINAPMVVLLRATERLSQGDLSARASISAANELGKLAHAFDAMADHLQELVGKVQDSGIQVASAATELAASARAQQVTASEQAATTSQMVVSTKEIASTARVLVENMDDLSHGADTASALAEEGRNDLLLMDASMKKMVEAVHDITSRLAVLNEKANSIGSIVDTIFKVADQTNLLSLNAAIEANKAGKHGLGFGVVATEIRRLSEQTAVSTWEIEQMVKEMQSAVSSGVTGMEKFSEDMHHGTAQVGQVGERLSRIVESMQQLAPHFDSVYEAMQAQSIGTDHINQGLEQVNQTVQGTAESMRESVLVVDQLNEASQRLQAAVMRFNVKVA